MNPILLLFLTLFSASYVHISSILQCSLSSRVGVRDVLFLIGLTTVFNSVPLPVMSLQLILTMTKGSFTDQH